jgi:hypothetical protein
MEWEFGQKIKYGVRCSAQKDFASPLLSTRQGVRLTSKYNSTVPFLVSFAIFKLRNCPLKIRDRVYVISVIEAPLDNRVDFLFFVLR